MFNLKNKIWRVVLGLIILVYCAIEAQGEGDFFIFLSAAGDLYHSANIYVKYYRIDYHYYYSVLFALLLKPFYFIPFFWVKLAWLVLNVLLFVHLFLLLINSNALKIMDPKTKNVFLFFVFLFSFRFFHDNIHASQITILILWCCIYGLYLIKNNRELSGSTLLAIGINIKLLPLVILPYLFYRGYFKAFTLTLLICAGMFAVPSLIIGHEYNRLLLESWWNLVNPGNQIHVMDVNERSFHGLTTLLSTLLVENVPDYYALPLKRNIADVSLQTLSLVILCVRLCLVAFTLYFLKLKIFKKAATAFDQCIELSYLLLLVPLIFPHQQHYAFLFAVPAFTTVLYYLALNYKNLAIGRRNMLIGIMVIIYLCANLKLLVGEFNRYYEHYKILTYGALLLIPLLVWVSRDHRHRNGAINEEVFR